MSKEKLGKIFDDQGMSGILEDKEIKLPNYLDKLAEQEKDFEPEKVEAEKLDFKALSLTRADELTDNEVRNIESNNKVNKEIEKEAGNDARIEKELKTLLTKGLGIKEIQKQLSRKFSPAKIKKYFEAHKRSIFNKYGQLGYTYLDKDIYDSCQDIKLALANQIKVGHNFISKLKVTDNSCSDCTMLKNGTCILTNLKVTDDPQITTIKEAKNVIKKLGQSNFLNKEIINTYIDLLKVDINKPQQVIATLLDSLHANKKLSGKIDDEGKVGFRRDIDKQELKERQIPDNNKEREARLKKDIIENKIFENFKESIQSGLSKKEAHVKIAKKFNYNDIDGFYKNYDSKIKSLIAFNKRQSFDTDFKPVSNVTETKDNEAFENEERYDESKLLRDSFNMMTRGYNLETIKSSLNKVYGTQTNKFLKENNRTLERHYGQLGYVFIDSNLYSNCQGNEMKDAFNGIKHYGKQLMYSVKANKKCSGCLYNKEGTCEKVGLMISNHPLVRSPRSARRVLAKAASFVPKEYIEEFSNKISDEGNIKLISSFNLGIKKVLENERKGIGKSASKDKSIDFKNNDFLTAVNPYNIDLFNDKSSSNLIDSIVKKEKNNDDV